MYERQEIESALAEGKKILNERPELRRMSIDAVLDELNDGTQEMVHNRRGVTAWMIVESIPDMKISVLVEHLAYKASGLLTDQYVGYLLQKQYHVNLELLILEAEKCGHYEKIVYYVLENLQYKEEYESNNLLPLLEMLEHHSNHNTYSRFLHYYSKHISNCKAFKIVADIISELKTHVQYDLMCRLKYLWYGEEVTQANEQLGFYANQQGEWHKKIIVEFIEASLYYDTSTFDQYFSQLKVMSQESAELWNQMIPVFVEYVRLKEHEDPLGSIIRQVLHELERIPNDAEKTKHVFIAAFVSSEKLSEHLSSIYQEIISRPFENKRIPYDLIDHYYYSNIEEGAIDRSLQNLQTIFRVNDIFADYFSFFDGFDLTFSEMAKSSADITGRALNYMLSNKLDKVFFGIGLFNKFGNLQSYLSKPETEKVFLSDMQLVRLMKGILYYTVESKNICHTALQLLALSNDECTQYFQFCMEEVYANYPATLYKITSEYITSDSEKQNRLAELVRKEYEQLLAEQEKVRAVMDLRPSNEHQQIYRKAQMMRNQEINKRASEQSIFSELFPSRMMKYGIRNAHIVTLSKNQKQVRESGYQHITYEMELPMVYTHNSVGYEVKKIEYIEEVKNSAADH